MTQLKQKQERKLPALLAYSPILVLFNTGVHAGTGREGGWFAKKRVETPNLVVANDLFNAVIPSTYGAKNNLHWTVILFLQSMLYTLL